MFADFWHGHLQSSLSAVSSHIVSIIPGYDVMTVESEWLIFRIGACRYLALFVLAMPVAAPAQEIDVYPPPPPRVSPVAGAIDFHVHSGPDVFGRGLLDSEVAAAAARAGMRGLVLKNHVTSTADRAYLVTRSVPGIEVFGGIVLNGAVGGINPVAVEWMHRMEGGRGKVVWLPTFEAAAHIAVFGGPERGLVAADSGTVRPETEAVLKIVAREDLVLQTGHISTAEALAVIRRGRDLGVENMIVTHAMADIPGMTIGEMKQAALMGAYLELVYLNHLMGPSAHLAWMRHWSQVSLADMADAIDAVGAAHFVLSSDLGQIGNPIHPDGYKMMVAGLKAAGITDDEIDLMMRRNPAKLLGLDD